MLHTPVASQPSILFIDRPEKIEKLLIEGMLGYPCYMEFAVGTRSETFALIEKNQPDLVISALKLPDGTALDLFQEMNTKIGRVPTILIADPTEKELQNEALRLGLFDLLHEPFDIHELIKKIDRAVHATKAFRKKTRLESFVEFQKLHEESQNQGLLIADLIDLKKTAV